MILCGRLVIAINGQCGMSEYVVDIFPHKCRFGKMEVLRWAKRVRSAHTLASTQYEPTCVHI